MTLTKYVCAAAAIMALTPIAIAQSAQSNPMHQRAATEYEALVMAQLIDGKCPSLDPLSRTAAELVAGDRWGYLVREGAMTSAQIAAAQARMKEAVAATTCAQLEAAQQAQAALRAAAFQRDLYLMIWGSYIAARETDEMMGDMMASYACGPFDADAVLSVRPLTGPAYARMKAMPNFAVVKDRTAAQAKAMELGCRQADNPEFAETTEMQMLKAMVAASGQSTGT